MNFKSNVVQIEVEGIKDLQYFYDTLSETIAKARKSSNFYCIDGCGACCNTAGKNLEVTLFEAIPMALAVIASGKAEEMLSYLESVDREEEVCTFYKKTNSSGSNGYCLHYEARPLICRLFGSSRRVTSQGEVKSIVCKPLKKIHFSDRECELSVMAPFPVAARESTTARSYNLHLTSRLFSINEALYQALHYVLQRIHYQE